MLCYLQVSSKVIYIYVCVCVCVCVYIYAPGVGDEQRSLACCSPWGCKNLDMTEQLN